MKLVVVATLIVFFIYLIILNCCLNKEKFWVAKRDDTIDVNFSFDNYEEVDFKLDKKDQPNVEKYAQDCAYTLQSNGLYKKLVIGEQDGKFKCYVNKPGLYSEEEEEE